MNLPSNQRGMGVTGIVLVISMLVICFKIGIGIAPAQVGNYQLKKSLAWELKKANDNKESEKEFLRNVEAQWSINGYNMSPKDVIEITKNTPGDMSVKLKYDEESNFFGNVFIVNRFEDDITAEDAKVATQ
ncbi:DUF4845 domain-containing protein [Faucicola boevrei]|uniref:DUF4845 domain-containing protein n=1 Tax=Faucicola boevrei TaxID=346665 RepID=UPI00037471C3|nr:DUF4845 domain-containing protein [Moraxella boevrei]